MSNHIRTVLLAAVIALLVGSTDPIDFASAAPAPTATATVPVVPYRLLDTRIAVGVPGTAPVGAGASIDVQIAGVGPVPANAVGVIVNLTGTQTTAPTYVTAWPTGTERPTASVLNLFPGVDAPNSVTALLGDGGRLSLYNYAGSTHLVADVSGYLIGGGAGTPGPTGPQGPAGPAGAGIAYGRIGGYGTPSIGSASSNVAAVARAAYGQTNGNYCVSFTSPIPAGRLAAAVVSTTHVGNYPNAVVTPLYCPAGQLGVLLHNDGFGANSDFSFIIP